MKLILVLFTAMSFLALVPIAQAAGASDTPVSSKPKNPNYVAGEKAIKAKEWQKAIDELLKAADADPSNADTQNYLGYAYRNLGQYDTAIKHYKEALSLNPKHRGALEYMGEAYLKLNDLPAAKKLLASLSDICTFGCEEYDELKEAVEAYEKAKN